jgi:glycosyltransferase involved in cell wall biosynthesis
LIIQVCIAPEESQGGLYRYISDFASIAPATTVALRSGNSTPPRAGERVVGVGRLGLTPYRLHLPARAASRLAAAIEGASHVVCHSLYRGHVASLAAICRSRGVPYSVVAHGMLDPWTLGRYRWLKKTWLRRGGRHAIEAATHLLLTTSREMEKAMPEVPRARPTILPPAVAPFADRGEEARRKARAALGVGADVRLLIWIGRFDRMKRPLETFRAFARSRPSRTVLAVAGFPATVQGSAIQRELAAAGPMVRYLGPVTGDRRRDLFSAADGFVSFSFRENFGYSFAEALAHGLPCLVSSGHDLLADIAGHSVGWIADAATDQWSECFTAFDTASDAALACVGAMNAAWAREHLSVDRMRRAIASLLAPADQRTVFA